MVLKIPYHEGQLLLDKEIADLTARIRLLNTQRNELAPVSQLPDEILLHIFLIVQDLYGSYSYKWGIITHISRHWRHVAVGSPALWTRLYNPPPGLAPLLLERSQSAPLEVELSALTPKHSLAISAPILREIKRIRKLSIYSMPPNYLDTIHGILADMEQNWEASLLELLYVSIRPGGGRDDTPVKLATDILRPTRLLRTLCVTNGYYDWALLPLPNLTRLVLSGRSLGEVSGSSFIEALRPMQNLEALVIRWQGINISQFPSTPLPQPIYLPRLWRLEIREGNQAHLISFLSLLIHPNLIQLEVSPRHPVISVATFTRSILHSIGKANFGLLEYFKIERQLITISSSSQAEVNDKSSFFISMYIPTEEWLNTDDDDDGTPFEFVVDVMSCVTLGEFPDRILPRHISLDSSDAPIDDFTRLFACFSSLETIKFYHDLPLVLFKALNINIAPATEDTHCGTSILFPKLRSITWYGEHLYTRPIPVLSATAFNDLYSGLLLRHAHGVPITKLDLVNCERLDDVQAHQLEEIGAKVIVRQIDEDDEDDLEDE